MCVQDSYHSYSMLTLLVGHERKLTKDANSAAAGRKNTKTKQKKNA